MERQINELMICICVLKQLLRDVTDIISNVSSNSYSDCNVFESTHSSKMIYVYTKAIEALLSNYPLYILN